MNIQRVKPLVGFKNRKDPTLPEYIQTSLPSCERRFFNQMKSRLTWIKMMGGEKSDEQLMIQSRTLRTGLPTGWLVFIDDVTADRSSQMDSEVVKTVCSNSAKCYETNGQIFREQMDDYSKHTVKAAEDFLKEKKWNNLQWKAQSSDFNPTEQLFSYCKKSWRQKGPETSRNMRWLQWRAGKASSYRNLRIWCPWAPDYKQSLSAKDK